MIPINALSRKPIKVSLSIESSSLRASSADSTGVLARLTTYFVDVENPSGRQVIEEPADRRQVLFDGGLGERGAELFDIGGYRDGLDLMKLQVALVGPVEELFHRARIGRARVAVTDVGGKEFDEAAAGAFALSPLIRLSLPNDLPLLAETSLDLAFEQRQTPRQVGRHSIFLELMSPLNTFCRRIYHRTAFD
jgi:hypothetical protein